MKKNTKRIITLVMAVLMLVALTTAAFAAQPDQPTSYSVSAYIRLQTADVATGDASNYTLGDLTNVVYLTGNAQTNYFVPVSVTKSTPVTVKDLVEALSGITVVSCTQHDSHGCIHSDTVVSGETACTCTACTCTWKRVKNMAQDPDTGAWVWDGTYSSAMTSLCYNNVTRTGSTYTEDYGGGHGYYEGTNWEYFVANSATGTNVYPNTLYMNQYVVSASEYITVSFDTSSFEW